VQLDRRAIAILFKGIETRSGRISSSVLDNHVSAKIAASLRESGLLAKDSDSSAIAPPADYDDTPIPLSWSPEGDSYGYFSSTLGWIEVETGRLVQYRIDIPAIIGSLISKVTSSSSPAPIQLLENILWEVGDVRLPRRTRRVSVWFARRLHDPSIWKQIQKLMQGRPSTDLRILLTTTPAARLPTQSVHSHFIVPVFDALEHGGSLVIDPAILAARVNNPFSAPDQIVTHSADFGVVTIRGNENRFTGSKQRALMAQLVLAWQSGQPKLLTTKVLLEAEYKDSVNTLAKAFSGRRDWRQFAAEDDGFCWLVV
jgi:hypothetical protein